jgi:hypothetical protein
MVICLASKSICPHLNARISSRRMPVISAMRTIGPITRERFLIATSTSRCSSSEIKARPTSCASSRCLGFGHRMVHLDPLTGLSRAQARQVRFIDTGERDWRERKQNERTHRIALVYKAANTDGTS